MPRPLLGLPHDRPAPSVPAQDLGNTGALLLRGWRCSRERCNGRDYDEYLFLDQRRVMTDSRSSTDSHELKRNEVLSFDDGLLTVKMSGHGEANGWATLAFNEKQFELDDEGYQIVEIPPSELFELRDFLNRILPSNRPGDRESVDAAQYEPEPGNGDVVIVKVPDGYDSVWDFLNDCGLETAPATAPVACRWRHVNSVSPDWNYQDQPIRNHNEYLVVEPLYTSPQPAPAAYPRHVEGPVRAAD